MKDIALALAALSIVLASGSLSVASDEAKGRRVFNKCRACHSLAVGISKIGPSLNGIIGRKAGNWKKKNGKLFPYSTAMRQAGKGTKPVTWNEITLKIFLIAPGKYIPGNRMSFPGLKKTKDHDNLLAYLRKATK
jgi:cytochrome c